MLVYDCEIIKGIPPRKKDGGREPDRVIFKPQVIVPDIDPRGDLKELVR